MGLLLANAAGASTTPVFLPQSMRPLAETKMGEIFVGTFAAVANNWNLTMTRGIRIGGPAIANAGGGVWTGGISDCMVVCSAYFESVLREGGTGSAFSMCRVENIRALCKPLGQV
jgi:hypothetical protein